MNFHPPLRKFVPAVLTAGLLFTQRAHPQTPPGYIAHEWGTFTSIQGSDGVPLAWQAQQVSQLPGFVFDWTRPGLDRRGLVQGKVFQVTLQRMETPVIYFYADREQSVDITVQFPKGQITEWYPQAFQVGPAMMPASAAGGAGNLHSAPDSRIRWAGITLLPLKDNAGLADRLPLDSSGSHYFAARETDSAFLSAETFTPSNPASQIERFLFYRGVGNFTTPLQVSLNAAGDLIATNTGAEQLAHLFVLDVQDGRGNFVHLDALAPGESTSVQLPALDSLAPIDEMSGSLQQALQQALASQGLFAREAAAMVDTWKDSWFTEEGVRVLYLLPRAWTEATLPLTLAPAPRELVRVMVGRAEIISPALERRLHEEITRAAQGDTEARARVADEFKKLGRFAGPALQLASKGLDPKAGEAGREIFSATSPPATR